MLRVCWHLTQRHNSIWSTIPVKNMFRRSLSSSSDEPSQKRPRLERHLTREDFKDGVFLAPMVRSGALPTRLFALKYGATLVWGPEVVDKAILHAERVVDPITGTVSYNGKSSAIFTTHPIEKPYLIYQIGSSDPDLAVQAAKTVMADVSGVELNCGCPKPFSTHSGMGAALLSTPDLLCSILTALRKAAPPEISVSAKIRLLPSQEDTLKLVERIVGTGITCLTVHCRTKSMRPKDKALVGRLREIVEIVDGLGKGVAVVENGDCISWEDAKRIRQLTGAHSVMIATAAESNPTVFSPTPLVDVERTLVPAYLRLCKHLNARYSLTKFCVNQFKGSHHSLRKADLKIYHETISKAKGYDDLTDFVGGIWNGEEEMRDIIEVLESRSNYRPVLSPPHCGTEDEDGEDERQLWTTPHYRPNPEPPGSRAPLGPCNEHRAMIPAGVSGHDAVTPTPGCGIVHDIII